MKLCRIGQGYYRLADFLIIRENWTPMWRVWWDPEASTGTHHGVPMDAFPTLRDAKACVLEELTEQQENARG